MVSDTCGEELNQQMAEAGNPTYLRVLRDRTLVNWRGNGAMDHFLGHFYWVWSLE